MSIVLKQMKISNQLILAGDITINQAPGLQDTLFKALELDLVVDMEQVTSLDTCCLQQMLAVIKELENKGKRVIVEKVSEAARETFILSGLTDYLSYRKEQK